MVKHLRIIVDKRNLGYFDKTIWSQVVAQKKKKKKKNPWKQNFTLFGCQNLIRWLNISTP